MLKAGGTGTLALRFIVYIPWPTPWVPGYRSPTSRFGPGYLSIFSTMRVKHVLSVKIISVHCWFRSLFTRMARICARP